MRIIIDTVPHLSQRYNTIGDWQWLDDQTLKIKVSDMGDWKKEFLVGIHEVIETMLCKHSGVTEADVDAFDLGHPELHEPGDSVDAPYHNQHNIAIELETILMQELEVDVDEYENKMEELQNERERIESESK